jgi:large repetitive protein
MEDEKVRKTVVFVLLVAAVVLASATAYAEDGYNAQLFWPSIFGGNFIAIEDANTLCPLGFGGGLFFNYADGPVQVLVNDDPNLGIVNQLFTADVLAAFGPFSFLSLGVDVPVHLFARGRDIKDVKTGANYSSLASETTLGDIRAEMKLRILQQKLHWLGFAVAPYATFPTGDPGKFLGEGRVTGGGTGILEHDFKVFNIGLNGGYQYRGNSKLLANDVGDAWKIGAGISKDFGGLSLSAEYWATLLNAGAAKDVEPNPMEIIGTLRYKFGSNGPRLVAGGGGGLTEGLGCPAYRILGGVDYYYCKPEPTEGRLIIVVRDQDGKPIKASVSVSGPKQWNFKSEDDPYKSDVAPGDYAASASRDGYDPDSAKGAVAIGKTTKLELTLKKIVLKTTLALTITDKFTGEKLESIVVFDQGAKSEKTIGAPKGEWTSAWEPGEYKAHATAKGYEHAFADIKVLAGKSNEYNIQLRKVIEKIGNIYFDFDSDVIKQESYKVLDDVIAKINQLGKWNKIIIEGHCSFEGTDQYNMNLSKRRATSVKNFLVAKGIPADKLVTEGFGETKPIDTNDTEEGRSKNRRVEFVIEE